MIAADEDALVCDLAETYGIYDYRALPAPLLATLASGLREDSRIKMRMAGVKASADTILLASAVDALNTLVWFKTKDARTGRNRPESILKKLLQSGDKAGREDEVVRFDSGESFTAAWKKLTGGEENG